MHNLEHKELVEQIVSDFFDGLMEGGILTEETIETENIYEILENMNITTAALNEYFNYDPEEIFEED
jgi:hypothetical protein